MTNVVVFLLGKCCGIIFMGILSCISSATNRLREVILPLHLALVGHMKYWVRFWALQYKTDMDILG